MRESSRFFRDSELREIEVQSVVPGHEVWEYVPVSLHEQRGALIALDVPVPVGTVSSAIDEQVMGEIHFWINGKKFVFYYGDTVFVMLGRSY